MKHYIAILCLLFCQLAQAQPNKGNTRKAPTKKDVDETLKQVQQMMDELSPEDRRMLDSLGVKPSSFKNLTKLNDQQLAQGWEEANRIVPKRDASRIDAIPPAFSNAGTAAYITSVQNKTLPQLKPAVVTMGKKIYATLQEQGSNARKTGNAAAALWIMGKTQLAFYIMGKACEQDATNTDNLSNYAAMLSMTGAPQLAIPLLNNLNTRFPRNSTLLNNLGQAWFALGDINKAEKYIDSTIRIATFHTQANYTKCLIEQSRGNNPGAIAAGKKSIRQGFSTDKEDRLRELGYQMNINDVTVPPMYQNDPLQLGGFTHPAFPKSVKACVVAQAEWTAFVTEIDKNLQQLQKELATANENGKTAMQNRIQQSVAATQASLQSGLPPTPVQLSPMYASRAEMRLGKTQEDYERKLKEYAEKLTAFTEGRGKQLQDAYNTEMKKLQEEDKKQTGEGKPNKDYCPLYREASDKFLNGYNTVWEQLYIEMLEIEKKHLNEDCYYRMYQFWPEEYENIKIGSKGAWLKALQQYHFTSITQYVCKETLPDQKSSTLAKFDDINCKYHSSFWTPVGTIQSDCSKTTTNLDIQVLKIGLVQDMDQKTFGDQFISCTVEMGASAGKEISAGPLTVGGEVGGGIGVEIDRTGVKDVFVTAGASAGVSIGDPLSVSAGMEGRISIISGQGTVSGTGIFENIK
ncbi:hypothetical protein SAMN05421788_101961 [Filimonas lacunae]|uniref:Uncharacterized protein n=1 Tax=Filimonas lacunae TaxID=477680 RepID=A0A173MQB1_9BACT|nr:hypothetical protein [Filimonas lacunae]BAV09528.1 hypothetical protein FLA_5577 [Filimonas lacunae]SIS74684.1 hypothetical protein SAMN05421788_101961 [Filimonas lacunae]